MVNGNGGCDRFLIAWVLLLAASRRFVLRAFQNAPMGDRPQRAARALPWAVVPFGFEVLGPDAPNLGLATFAAALLGLGGFLGTAFVLKVTCDSTYVHS